MVMQRRLTSSIYAITRTLANRLTALDGVLLILNDPVCTAAEKRRLVKGEAEDVPASIDGYEELDEKERADVDKRIFRQVLTDDPEEVERERGEIEDLLRMAEGLRNHIEAKFSELLSVLDSSNVIRKEEESSSSSPSTGHDGQPGRPPQKERLLRCYHPWRHGH